MYKNTILTVVAMCAVLAGCGSTPKQYQYRDDLSYANNVAKAGRMADLEDTVVPSGSGAVDTTDFASLGILTSAGLIDGMSMGSALSSGLGMTLALGLMEPSDELKYPAVLAWMPSSMAEDEVAARHALEDMMGDAVEKALQEMGVPFSREEKKGFGTSGTYFSVPPYEAWGCGPESHCQIRVQATRPRENTPAPSFLSETNSESTYMFEGNGYIKSNITITHIKKVGIPYLDTLVAISKHLPEWAYMYNPPGSVKEFKAPFILNQGNLLLFVVPENKSPEA